MDEILGPRELETLFDELKYRGEDWKTMLWYCVTSDGKKVVCVEVVMVQTKRIDKLPEDCCEPSKPHHYQAKSKAFVLKDPTENTFRAAMRDLREREAR